MDKLWNVTLRWCKHETPRLEITLGHYIKGDAIYIVYIQLYKLVFGIHFDLYEQHRRNTGYYD